MNLNEFQNTLKEHFIKPMDEFYRERYEKIFEEKPPEDSKLMMDKMIKHGESQVLEIMGLPKAIEPDRNT